MKITRKMKRSITKILVLIFVSLMTGATPAFAQKLTTYWMGRHLPNDSKIHFDVKVPDFFAKWIDELKPKTVTHQINGKEWEITTLTLKWDENGSSPKRTGQIQFEGFGDMSWKQHATAQWEPFADQLYAMKSPAEGSWFSVKDINFIKSDADPQLTAAMNLPRTASDNKHPRDLSYNFTKVPEIIAVASGDNTVDVAWRTTGTDPEVYVGRYRVNPTGATTLISPTPVGLGEGYRYLAGFTRDSDGSLYVLRAKRDAPIWNKQHPEKVDRTDVMVLTKFDKNFKLIYKNKPLGTAGKSRSGAIYAPMAVEFNSDANPLGGQEDGTSRIAWTNYGGKSVIFAYYSCLTEYDGKINRRHQSGYYRVLDATTGDPVPDYNRDSFGHTMATDLLASDDGVISVGRNDTGLFLANHLKYATQDRDPRVFVFNHVWNGNDSFSELGMLASAEAATYCCLRVTTAMVNRSE